MSYSLLTVPYLTSLGDKRMSPNLSEFQIFYQFKSQVNFLQNALKKRFEYMDFYPLKKKKRIHGFLS